MTPDSRPAAAAGPAGVPPSGPPAARVDPVVEDLHGTAVPDPYRWLEDPASAEMRAWEATQDAWTRARLAAVPGHEALAARLAALAALPRVEAPVVAGGRLFFLSRRAGQDQPVLCVGGAAGAAPRVVLDPNAWAADATVALDWWQPTHDGRQLAYGTSPGGSELSTLHTREVETGAAGSEAIPHTRACAVAWLPDASGFYYTRSPAPGEVPAGDERYHRSVFFHDRATGAPDGRGDPCVFGAGLAKEAWPSIAVSRDGRWAWVTVSYGWTRATLHLCDRQRPGDGFRTLVDGPEALYAAEVHGDRLYVWTTDGAPRGRVCVADLAHPEREAWRTCVPEGDATLEGAQVVGGRLVCRELRRAHAVLRIHALTGRAEVEVPLPGLGTVHAVAGEADRPRLVHDFEPFLSPPALFARDLATGRGAALAAPVRGAPDPARFVTEQVEIRSRDGTPLTMFVARRRDVTPDGARPVLLTGYGGFAISRTPMFSPSWVTWLELGGVLALPNLRGGGEYGEAWHRAGMLERKQNVFDDFAAAADWCVTSGWTRPERLALVGGSNGGLLVLAALTQRPEACRAVVAAVPLSDMVRYHRFLLARLWIPEYGSAEEPAAFRWLHAYSPYHRVREGTRYPAVLLTTGESDTRVDPCHARKMAARLQAASASGRPVYLRIERKAGHGIGMPVRKAVEGQADVLAFLCAELGVEVPADFAGEGAA